MDGKVHYNYIGMSVICDYFGKSMIVRAGVSLSFTTDKVFYLYILYAL